MYWTKIKKKLKDIGKLINDSYSDKGAIMILIGISIIILVPAIIDELNRSSYSIEIMQQIMREQEDVMASVKEKTYWDYLYTGKDYVISGIVNTGNGILYISTTVVKGVVAATTILVIASAGIKVLSDPGATMGFVSQVIKGTFTQVLQGLGIITQQDQTTSPTVAMVFIGAVAFGSISFALAQKFFSHYAPIRSVIPQAIPESNAAIPESNIPTLKKEDILELIKDNNSLPELINNVTYLQYLLLTLVIILATMLYIQIVPLIRDEINKYRDNAPMTSKIALEDNKDNSK
jgi:hypothetical protein